MSDDTEDRLRRAAGAQAIRNEEEGKVKKIFSLFGAWLTTEDNDELLGKVDETLGTKLQEARRQAGGAAIAAARAKLEDQVSRSASPRDCFHSPPCAGPRCTVYSEPERDRSRAPETAQDALKRATIERLAREKAGPIVLVKKRAVCTVCRGHGALEFDEESGETTPVPCPSCKTLPKAAAAPEKK